ncbi:hypothetical protein EJB05_24470, partial [Eragrostis curvula]
MSGDGGLPEEEEVRGEEAELLASLSNWPPPQETRDASVRRLVQSLSGPGGVVPEAEAERAAAFIEAQAFAAGSAYAAARSPASVPEGLEALPVRATWSLLFAASCVVACRRPPASSRGSTVLSRSPRHNACPLPLTSGVVPEPEAQRVPAAIDVEALAAVSASTSGHEGFEAVSAYTLGLNRRLYEFTKSRAAAPAAAPAEACAEEEAAASEKCGRPALWSTQNCCYPFNDAFCYRTGRTFVFASAQGFLFSCCMMADTPTTQCL